MIKLENLTTLIPEDHIIDFQGESILVKRYLKIEDKLALIGRIVNASIDDNNYYNPARLHIFYVMNMINTYTDISLDSMDILAAYDIVISTGLWDAVESVIDEQDKAFIKVNINSIIDNVYAYKNSIMGILDLLSQNTEISAEALEKAKTALADPEINKTLKVLADGLGQAN